MVFETYWLGAGLVATVFIILGWQSKTSLGRSFLIWGGLVFILLGLMAQTEGIDREVNWDVGRNVYDNNRVSDINVSSVKYFASADTTSPATGTQNDFGLYIISQIMYFIFGWIIALYGFYLTFSLAWQERFGKGGKVNG